MRERVNLDGMITIFQYFEYFSPFTHGWVETSSDRIGLLRPAAVTADISQEGVEWLKITMYLPLSVGAKNRCPLHRGQCSSISGV